MNRRFVLGAIFILAAGTLLEAETYQYELYKWNGWRYVLFDIVNYEPGLPTWWGSRADMFIWMDRTPFWCYTTESAYQLQLRENKRTQPPKRSHVQ